MTSGEQECYACRSLSGEKRISPGPIIHEGQYWVVDHAYPCAMLGWLVIVLKRHAEALHELSANEFSELGALIERVSKALRDATRCRKEYLACYSEAAHFAHVHVHVVARMDDLTYEMIGPNIFKMLQVSEEEAVPPEKVAEFCEGLRGHMQKGTKP